MFKFFCILSCIASAIFLIATINDISYLPMLISGVLTAIVFACVSSFQNETEEKLASLDRTIGAIQQRCSKLEQEVEQLKRK